MTIYPNYFLHNENFYKNKDLTLINFLHRMNKASFFKIIKIYLKLRNKNILVAEKFVNYQDILRATSNSISRLIYLKKNNNNFFIDKITTLEILRPDDSAEDSAYITDLLIKPKTT